MNYSYETDKEFPETDVLALKFVVAHNQRWATGWSADEFSSNPISDMLQLVMMIPVGDYGRARQI